jgi:membrane protein
LRWPTAAIAMTSMVAFMYYCLPNVQEKGRFVIAGSVVAVLGWFAASLGLRFCVAHVATYARIYGALGTVVLLLVWLYLWGITLIVGGEINAILNRRARRSEAPTPPAPRRRAWRPFAPRPSQS